MSNEYITLEFYEVKDDGYVKGDDPIMYASNVSVVPRVGDILHLCRTEKVLGIDPDKEHRNFKVIGVEWWYHNEDQIMIKHGTMRQIAIFCKRELEAEFK